MICNKCNKDHTVKNDGSLTSCERDEYFKGGAKGHDGSGKTVIGFGIGQNRFQFNGAK